MAASSIALLWALGLGIIGGGRWRWSWGLALLAFGGSICQAELPGAAALHWLGLALLVLAVGPVILNPSAMEVRSAVWQFSTNGILALTGIFILWYLLRLPSYGVGFWAFMYQCMLLAPIVGLGIVMALARAIHGRSWLWGMFALLGFIPLLAAASRVAIVATLAGVCYLLIRRKPVIGLGTVVLCAVLIHSFISQSRSVESPPDSLTGAVNSKGDLNSRANLWEYRWSEFKSSPIVGIGVGMGSDNSGGGKEKGGTGIEPGSCYLAVLAMTGGLGSVFFCTAFGLLLAGFLTSRQRVRLDKDILYVVGIYLAVHGIAEGWVLSFGSPLCLVFWLWAGRVGDFTLQRSGVTLKPRLVQRHGIDRLAASSNCAPGRTCAFDFRAAGS
jgi:hypothetical protein